MIVKHDFTLLEKYSALNKLLCVTGYCLRFVNNSRKKRESRQFGPLTPGEIQNALYQWIKQVQQVTFRKELKSLSKSQELSNKSGVKRLNPFIDSSGILRVGGRLQNAKISYDQKHPILLPRSNHLSNLIVKCEHLKNLHAGTQLLLSTLQQRYWIIHGRDVVKQIIRKCVTCLSQRAQVQQQQMANIPKSRLEPARPFFKCGLDYGGPYTIKLNNLRGRSQQKCDKAYIALFVCMTTKAIHLELVSDLTTEAFLAAFRRFSSRRGKSCHIFSGNGTNFVGAAKELRNFLKSHKITFTSTAAAEGVSWHFIPPNSPHFGGLWEAGIKSTKHHLRRVLGNTILNFEEFTTLLCQLCQVEACLNSRPLCALSTDPSDLTRLTPGHFLIGEPLNSIPEPDYTELNANRVGRWKLLQQLTQHIWNRWMNEYFSQLQQRVKWNSTQPNIQLNDLVLVKEDNLPPTKWNLGRVLQIHPGSDNIVRVATIKTTHGTFKRPIVKLCLLPRE